MGVLFYIAVVRHDPSARFVVVTIIKSKLKFKLNRIKEGYLGWYSLKVGENLKGSFRFLRKLKRVFLYD